MGDPSGAPCLRFGFLWLSVIWEHKWVTVAAVGCPSLPGGAVRLTRQHSTSRALETPARPFVLVCDWSRSHECPPSAGCPSQLPRSLGRCPSRPGPLYCAPSNFPCSFCSKLHSSKHTLGLWPWQRTVTTLSSALTPPRAGTSQIQHQLAMTSCLVTLGNETAWT